MKTDILIVGCGVSGLYCALNLPRDKQILIITKSDLTSSDSFLAQGGICMLKSPEDYDSFFEDTLRAGHYENNRESVDIMIRSSGDVIRDLMGYGVEFAMEGGKLCFTREGAHSTNRILYHEDITGEEITSKLLAQVKKLENVTLWEYTQMVDLLEEEDGCGGIIARDREGRLFPIQSRQTMLACGGIGGLFLHSTNFPHLTGDGLAVCLKHGVRLQNPDYIQIHPTTLYTGRSKERQFLISESVRGEGALLYNQAGERFVNELLPRDLLTQKIYEQMEKDQTPCVWLDMRPIGEETLRKHFPHILERCRQEGYDPLSQRVPIVPAQHYFMGGIWVDRNSRTSMNRLYAAGETSCNGVHGANRLASNSLLESLVFAKRAAMHMTAQEQNTPENAPFDEPVWNPEEYQDDRKLEETYKTLVLREIEKASGGSLYGHPANTNKERTKKIHEQHYHDTERGSSSDPGTAGGYHQRGHYHQFRHAGSQAG